MTIRSHLAQVFQQGIWASLTGGWFYDPRQTIFCNTVHLYVWLLLMLLPFVLGLVAPLSIIVMVAYCAVVCGVFAVIKSVTLFLHTLLDSHEPILRDNSYEEIPGETLASQKQRRVAYSSVVGETVDEDEGTDAGVIEMTALPVCMGDRAAETSYPNANPISTSAPDFLNKVSSSENDIVVETGKLEDLVGESSETSFCRNAPRRKSSTTGKTVRIQSIEDMAVVEADVHVHTDNGQTGSLTASSDTNQDFAVDTCTLSRKYSDPYFHSRDPKHRRSSDGQTKEACVRRAKSTLETRDDQYDSANSSLVLSHQTLEECKLKGTRKSYPSKTSSTDIFLSQARPPREMLLRQHAEDSADYNEHMPFPPSPSKSCADLEARGAVPETIQEDPHEILPSCSYQPEDKTSQATSFCSAVSEHAGSFDMPSQRESVESDQLHSSSARPDSPRRDRLIRSLRDRLQALRSDDFQTASEREDKGVWSSVESAESASQSNCSTPDISWLFVDDQQDNVKINVEDTCENDLENLPSTSTAAIDLEAIAPVAAVRRSKAIRRRISEEPRPGTSSGLGQSENKDLKEELKVLLEEIIESHPEALEAIESVRQSRLGLAADSHSSRSLGFQADRRSDDFYSSLNTSGMSVAWRGNILPRYRSHGPIDAPNSPGTSALSALAEMASKSSTHVANSHEDTTEGSVHCFQDEDGNWFTYAFDRDGVGMAQPLGNSKAVMQLLQTQQAPKPNLPSLLEPEDEPDTDLEAIHVTKIPAQRRDSSDDDDFIDKMPSSILHPVFLASRDNAWRSELEPTSTMRSTRSVSRRSTNRSGGGMHVSRPNPLQLIMQGLAASAASSHGGGATTPGEYSSMTLGSSMHYPAVSGSLHTSSLGSGTSLNRIRFLTGMNMAALVASPTAEVKRSLRRRHFYKLKPLPKVFPKWTFNLNLDRLELLSLFDKNRNWMSAVFDSLLAVTVTILASLLLNCGYFHDISMIVFCVVVAGAQFSLLKSVQPDASSPVHGYNWLVTYSRPAYFCGAAILLLVAHYLAETQSPPDQYRYIEWVVSAFIVFLPLTTTFGFLPMITTLVMHVCEQVDILVFGGTAAFSPLSSLFMIGRSVLGVSVCMLIGQAALSLPPEPTQNVVFSCFISILVSISYILSRSSSNPSLLACLLCANARKTGANDDTSSRRRNQTADSDENEEKIKDKNQNDRYADAEPGMDLFTGQLLKVASKRMHHDLLVGVILSLATFGLHCTSAFSVLNPALSIILTLICLCAGLINHYILPQLRQHTPLLLFSSPVLKCHEYFEFDPSSEAKLMWFEYLTVIVTFVERNILYPCLVVSLLTEYGDPVKHSVGDAHWLAALALSVMGMKLLRYAYTNPAQICWPLLGSIVIMDYQPFEAFPLINDNFLVHFYLASILWPKLQELYLKLEFIVAYIAPWQVSWGSAFHAFAQPFAVPHSALTLAQATVSSILSAPLNPFLGSSFFVMSYVRPIKFWEKDYNTRRVDHSNTRLISHIDRGPMTDDSNLNAIFYEHLTRSLQECLAGDLVMGRWATAVAPGDCFILQSYYLNCLVHLIEIGNGFVTFQLRGLEFRGTYCQQREVEAISEDVTESSACCCCQPGRIPGLLSLNVAWGLRWFTWQVINSKYIVQGYSITDNSAVSMLQVHELRRLLVTFYMKCIIYYALTSPKLEAWLNEEAVVNAMQPILNEPVYVDIDPTFNVSNDEDYDMRRTGVSIATFTNVYGNWLKYCAQCRKESIGDSSMLVPFCYSLSLVGRRALAAAAHNRHSSAAESCLYGLHALFKGDFRITCSRDEWVFADMDILRCVIAPAVRMGLKLHQDHFALPDEFDKDSVLFDQIARYESDLFISHEYDPAWRRAILSNAPYLLALRHVFDDGQDDFKVMMLTRRHLSFRVIKLNRESVRALWSGQQQELIFMRNRNPERGSIQNAKQVLRNMINSSADQPIGYPIYVSPLTTSFVESHPQLSSITGPPFTAQLLRHAGQSVWAWLRTHCGTSGSSHLTQTHANTPHVDATGAELRMDTRAQSVAYRSAPRNSGNMEEAKAESIADDKTQRLSMQLESAVDPTSTVRLVGVRSLPQNSPRRTCVVSVDDSETSGPRRNSDSIWRTRMHVGSFSTARSSSIDYKVRDSPRRVRIVDTCAVFDKLNEPLGSTGHPVVSWPTPYLATGGKNGWGDWKPAKGTEGTVVHTWSPSHPERQKRSHLGSTILLIRVSNPNVHVPVREDGVVSLGNQV